MTLLEGFGTRTVAAEGAEIHLRLGGDGLPLLLLHGYPQTSAMWHRVAPGLAERFTVVAADLRGYGRSSKPPSDPDHLAYSKRAMALDMVQVMAELGFGAFAVAGHDRGGRVGYRMALDHPAVVTRLAVLDIVPTYVMWRRMDRELAEVSSTSSMARSLCSVSAHSASGSEPGTMPAPAIRWARRPARVALRMATAHSPSPARSTQPTGPA
jgi:pimeloyl-ACP methyl ester carboxylesterase